MSKLKIVIDTIEKRFEKKVADRLFAFVFMCKAVDASNNDLSVVNQKGMELNLSNTANLIAYLQSRRAYYLATLNLIPKIATGNKKIPFMDTLNFLNQTMDRCLVNITSAYYNLVLNHCLEDFEINCDGNIAKGNIEYNHLEEFFIEPERLSLFDQLEFRGDVVVPTQSLPKVANKLFSYSEIANVMALIEAAFNKYQIHKSTEFLELNLLLCDIAVYASDDYSITIDENDFAAISSKYKSLTLYLKSDNYFENLNNYSPFQKSGRFYHTTLILITRFLYRTLSQSLSKNKTFQINAGFIFEDRVSHILETKGFMPTGITRINRKEFDLITIKNNKVFNFQCKNNFIDISRVHQDYKKIGRLNKQLCHYYEKALSKEESRENLITVKTGIREITHFVVSRYPVITRNKKVINFVDLERWTC